MSIGATVTVPRFDALLIPAGWPPGFDNCSTRSRAIAAAVVKYLGNAPYCHRDGQPDAFLSHDPGATLIFPAAHAHAGEPRYSWVESEEGLMLGSLTDEARNDPP